MYTKHDYTDVLGGGFHYLKYTPKDAEAGKKLPLLVFLHGAGERGNADGSELDRVANHGYFKQMKEDKDFSLLMVAPQCPRDHYWGSYLESLNRFLDAVIAENPVDTNRIYLTGLSMGGTGTWLWGLGNPERFAAIAPVCGEGIAWYGEKLANTPVHAFHGDIDEVVSPHESLAMVASINKRGGNAKLTLYHGVKHDAWNYAYDGELLNWFLQHALSN